MKYLTINDSNLGDLEYKINYMDNGDVEILSKEEVQLEVINTNN